MINQIHKFITSSTALISYYLTVATSFCLSFAFVSAFRHCNFFKSTSKLKDKSILYSYWYPSLKYYLFNSLPQFLTTLSTNPWFSLAPAWSAIAYGSATTHPKPAQKTSLEILIAESIIGYLSSDSRILDIIVAALSYFIVSVHSKQLPSVIAYSKQRSDC